MEIPIARYFAHFSGDGYTISNLTFTAPSSLYTGLFSYLSPTSNIIRDPKRLGPQTAPRRHPRTRNNQPLHQAAIPPSAPSSAVWG